jgi:hypothetical protein
MLRRVLITLALCVLAVAPAGAAIGRTALGVGAGTIGGASITLTSGGNVTVGQGSTIVVFIEYDVSVGLLSGISWSGQAFTQSGVPGSNVVDALGTSLLECWTLTNANAGTGAITADATTATPVAQWRATFVEVTGASTSGSVDKYTENSGASASPTSNSPGVRGQANEMIVGCVAWGTGAISGTWSSSFTAGQSSAGTGFAIEDSYLKATSASPGLAAAKTGATNTNWAAVVVTIKEAAATSSAHQRSFSGRSRVRIR